MKFDSIGSKSPVVETNRIHKIIVNKSFVHKINQLETAFEIGDMTFVNDARKELVYQLEDERSR